jgi:hypothetical protein
MYQRTVAAIVVVAIVMALTASTAQQRATAQQEECRTFPETGKMVCSSFLTYWKEHGGLAQQGLPVTSVFSEQSETDGKHYAVQYFERAVFELHPENKPPYDVLLSLLGTLDYKARYPGGAPGQKPNDEAGSVLFRETGKRVGGVFLSYWQSHGGLMQQGYPISDEFVARSPLDGKEYRVQYFERAVFEYHPENKPPYDVLLSQLGTFQLKRKYPGGDPAAAIPTTPPDPFPALRQRPLQLPLVRSNGSCPTTHAREIDYPTRKLLVFGNGPVYVQMLQIRQDGMLDLTRLLQSDGFYGIKAPWFSEPQYMGPILVRGRQLDEAATNRLLFGYDEGGRHQLWQEEMRLNDSCSSGWCSWPGAISISGPGCYGLQIDGEGFTYFIIFKAIYGNTPFDAEEDARNHPSAPPPEKPTAPFQEQHPGTVERKCVDVERHEVVRSGEFVAGPFRLYKEQWRPDLRPNEGKLWWVPLHQDQMRWLTVRAFSLDNPAMNRFYDFGTVASNREGDQFYPSGIPLPVAGRWRLVATSGPDWGCFDLTIDK